MASAVSNRGETMKVTLKEELGSIFDKIHIAMPEETRMVVTVQKDAVLSVLSFLKNHEYRHLGLISCVDWIDEKMFELVYILSAYMQENEKTTGREKMHIMLKTKISREKARFYSVIPIFENAEPYEREIHELFGIHFEGHPRLEPLFLERKYKIPPFRKDFDTRKYVKDFFDSIPLVEKMGGNK
jgi:NADH-quinone oxidoreductase subunit C